MPCRACRHRSSASHRSCCPMRRAVAIRIAARTMHHRRMFAHRPSAVLAGPARSRRAVPGFRLGIMERLVLVVAQDGSVFIHVHHVISGKQRNLAAAARRIDHEMRHGHPARVALQRLNDIQSRLDRWCESDWCPWSGPLGTDSTVSRAQAGVDASSRFMMSGSSLTPLRSTVCAPKRNAGIR